MLGVVLWSDASDGKAVIWCEDQGDLAFLNSSEDSLRTDSFFDAGDLVQFDMQEVSSLRQVSNPRLLLERAATQLPNALRVRGKNAHADTPLTADVLPFRKRAAAAF